MPAILKAALRGLFRGQPATPTELRLVRIIEAECKPGCVYATSGEQPGQCWTVEDILGQDG
jgi:hypothetical protein